MTAGGGGDGAFGEDTRDDVKSKFPWKIATLLFVNLLGLSMICWSLFWLAFFVTKKKKKKRKKRKKEEKRRKINALIFGF